MTRERAELADNSGHTYCIPPPSDRLGLEDTLAQEKLSASQTDTVVDIPRSGDETVFQRGDELGRYVVLKLLGRGGMGEVYAAYDPELDRKVAVKVIHAAMKGIESSEKARARLVREAQTLAKLSHPNVVAVFDVGELDGDVYVAMEFIEGSELGVWVKEEKRAVADILDVFLAAGEGLRAAHDQGLAHRDFKPENVILGGSRARVIDFGIARITGGSDSGAPLSRELSDALIDELATNRQISSSLETRTGALVGTPAYMAPEQFLGGAPDARSDQFSFCVALWEALSGSRPFAGKNVADLSAAVLSGERQPIPSSIPSRVARGLERGLAQAPDDRFATMGDLLDAIRPPSQKRYRPALLVGIALAAAAATAAAVFLLTDDAKSGVCADVGTEASEVWTDARRARMIATFEASADGNAMAASERVSQTLDEYSASWTSARQQVCEASSVRREQSPEVAQRRVACLGERLAEMRAVVALLEGATGDFVESAIETVDGLARIDDCANVARLGSAPEVPAEILGTIAEIRALNRGRKFDEGIELARAAIATAQEAGSLAGRARATAELGRLIGRKRAHKESLELLFEAIRLADDAGDTFAEAETWIEVVRNVGWRQQRFEEARRWVKHATLAIRQDGSSLELEARLRHTIGSIERSRGDHTAALANFRAAYELFREAGLENTVTGLRAKAGVSGALRALERHDEAIKLQREVLAERTALFGAGDPQMSSAHTSMATSLVAMQKYEDAREHYDKAIKLRIQRSGPEDPGLAWMLRRAGELEELVGDLDGADAIYKRELSLRRKGNGEAHRRTLQARERLGRIEALRGNRAESLSIQRQVIVGLRALGNNAKADMAISLGTLCELERQQGALSRARRSCEEATRILSKSAPDPRDLATALTAAARVELDAGRDDDAAELAERALEIRRANASPARALIETLLVVANTRLSNLETRGSVAALLDEAAELEPKLHPSERDIAASVSQLRKQLGR